MLTVKGLNYCCAIVYIYLFFVKMLILQYFINLDLFLRNLNQRCLNSFSSLFHHLIQSLIVCNSSYLSPLVNYLLMMTVSRSSIYLSFLLLILTLPNLKSTLNRSLEMLFLFYFIIHLWSQLFITWIMIL